MPAALFAGLCSGVRLSTFVATTAVCCNIVGGAEIASWEVDVRAVFTRFGGIV